MNDILAAKITITIVVLKSPSTTARISETRSVPFRFYLTRIIQNTISLSFLSSKISTVMNHTNLNSSSIEVMRRIEILAFDLIQTLHLSTIEKPLPLIIQGNPLFSHNPSTIPSRSLRNLSACRIFSSIIMILNFIHALLLQGRTTSTREVYYFFATHFRSQRECDGVILDVARLLGVSRVSLGLSASPKGE